MAVITLGLHSLVSTVAYGIRKETWNKQIYPLFMKPEESDEKLTEWNTAVDFSRIEASKSIHHYHSSTHLTSKALLVFAICNGWFLFPFTSNNRWMCSLNLLGNHLEKKKVMSHVFQIFCSSTCFQSWLNTIITWGALRILEIRSKPGHLLNQNPDTSPFYIHHRGYSDSHPGHRTNKHHSVRGTDPFRNPT